MDRNSESQQGARQNPFVTTQGSDVMATASGRIGLGWRFSVFLFAAGLISFVIGAGVISLMGGWSDSAVFGVLVAVLLYAVAMSLFYQSRKSAEGLNRKLLKGVLESDGDGRVVTDSVGRIVTANDGYKELFEGKLPSPHRISSIRPNARAIIDDMLNSLELSGEASGVIPNRTGRVEASINVNVVRYGNYQVWGFSAIDNERQFRERIDLFQGRFSSILDYFSLGIVIVDEAGYVRFMNPRARAQLNKDERNSFILHESELPDWDVEAGLSSKIFGERFEVPIQFDNSGKTLGRVYVISPALVDTGTAPAVDPVFLARVFEESPIAIASVDQSGSLLAFNTSLKSLLGGMSAKDVSSGSALSDFWSGEDLKKIMAGLAQAYEGHPPKAGVEIVCGKGDNYRIVQVLFGKPKSDDRRAINLFLIDTTDMKHLEIQFAQAQKMQAVGQLAGGVAHDFNNLLTAIIGFSDIVLSRYGPKEQSFSDLMQIKQNANRAANLVRQLLAFSRQQTMKTEIVSVTDVLDDTSDLIRRLLGVNIELRVIHGRDIAPIRFDVGQLEQIIINMAVNARDAMEAEGGIVTIRTSNISVNDSEKQGYQVLQHGEYVRIDIEDMGTGIPEEHLSKIFEPFFTTKPVGKGTGLGLSMVYGIVKQSGGYVFAESDLGRGTVFKIYIPKCLDVPNEQPADKHDEKPDNLSALTGKETILFIEDEDAVRLFAVRALLNKGYNVLEAASGEAAIEIMKHYDGHIDLIISDLMMPNMDGYEVVERAIRMREGVKIIIISGYAEDSLRRKIDNVSYQFLPKPFSLDELAKQVRRTLESRPESAP